MLHEGFLDASDGNLRFRRATPLLIRKPSNDQQLRIPHVTTGPDSLRLSTEQDVAAMHGMMRRLRQEFLARAGILGLDVLGCVCNGERTVVGILTHELRLNH